ncbi:uncharacterized protein J4E92_007619 [Alternaria infectoria]|uniref:uncharacterized protein n=1 Tax=Alternaria infectoria TaxID=45303 RepID=UPI00221FBC22|nr:uncharacterized protein J4E92_007619 [Alternaria infectoria]KAI4923645.1 hypothetical protein J4E92_007619 [Alternaria infectoria]
MATHTVIEIPKTTSAAADPRAPSIVTTLPPEIRNRIYEHLFAKDGPVLLDDGNPQMELLSRDHVTQSVHGNIEQQLREYKPCHVFGDCIGLLLSCRQVYHEAVGILYGHNTFLFSRFLVRQMHFTCKWLSNIGSHYQLLSHVHIDADALVTKLTRAYDLLPLLKLIWFRPQAKCKISFVLSGRSLSKKLPYNRGLYDLPPSMELMNGVLFALGTADALSLRQYARYSGLISSIRIWYNDHGYTGFVQYTGSDSSRRFPHPVKHFEILDYGTKVQWERPQQSSLLSLPDVFLSAINTYASASDTGVVFDLDIKKAWGYHVGLSGVNRFLRCDIDRMVTRVYDDITIRMSTREAMTDFGDFKALQELMDIETFQDLLNPYECREEARSIEMVLMFKLFTQTPTADLRININNLLKIYERDHEDLSIIIQESDSSTSGTRSIIWQYIQGAVFLLLSDVLKQYPSQASQPLPHIWINGHGTVLSATYPATATSKETSIPCSYPIDDPVGNLLQGYRKLKHLHQQGGELKRIVAAHRPGPGLDSSSLVGMWYSLRWLFGVDHIVDADACY